MAAIIIGFIGAVVCYLAVAIIKNRLGYDDSLDAFGIHGVGGTWGAIATGLWATTTINPDGANGLFYGGSLLGPQLLSLVIAYVFAIVGTFILLKSSALSWICVLALVLNHLVLILVNMAKALIINLNLKAQVDLFHPIKRLCYNL